MDLGPCDNSRSNQKSRRWNNVGAQLPIYEQDSKETTKMEECLESFKNALPENEVSNRSLKTNLEFEQVLGQVEKERNILMATLEQIIIERGSLTRQESFKIQFSPGRQRKVGDTEQCWSSFGPGRAFDYAEELRETYSLMAQMITESDETLSILEKRHNKTLERAKTAEQKITILESQMYHAQAAASFYRERASEASAEESRARVLLKKKNEEIEALQVRTDRDIRRLEMNYQEKIDDKEIHIQELSRELEVLRESLEETKSQIEQAFATGNVEQLKLQSRSLALQLEESGQSLQLERSKLKSLRIEMTKLRQSFAESEAHLKAENERLCNMVRKADDEKLNLMEYLGTLEDERDNLKRNVARARAHQRAAEERGEEIKRRYEDSLKHRLSVLHEKAELDELENSILRLKEAVSGREKKLNRHKMELGNQGESSGITKVAEIKVDAAERISSTEKSNKCISETEGAEWEVDRSEREVSRDGTERLRQGYDVMTFSDSEETQRNRTGGRKGVEDSRYLLENLSCQEFWQSPSLSQKYYQPYVKVQGKSETGEDSTNFHVRKRNTGHPW